MLAFRGPASTNETWDIYGSPYVLQGNVYVDSPGRLVVTDGTEVVVAAGAQIVVDHILVRARAA